VCTSAFSILYQTKVSVQFHKQRVFCSSQIKNGESINFLGLSWFSFTMQIKILFSQLCYILGRWTFSGFNFSLNNRTFLGSTIWPHSHIPDTNVPEYPLPPQGKPLHHISGKISAQPHTLIMHSTTFILTVINKQQSQIALRVRKSMYNYV